MNHDQVAELLGAYALDAVEPEEAVLVAAHVADCPRCAAELADHVEVASMLGDLGGDAPRELWESISSQATAPALAPRSARLAANPVRRRDGRGARRRLAGAVVVAVAAAAIAVMAVQVADLNGRVSKLTALTRSQGLNEAAQAALLDPTARRVVLSSTASPRAMVAELVVVPGGHSYLLDASFGRLPATQTYQLWAVRGSTAVSLGLLGAHPEVVPFVAGPSARPTVYAVTVEPAAGVPSPTQAPIAES